MGKVRIKTFDESENAELEAKKKAKREAKKADKASKKDTVEVKETTETVETPEEEIKNSEETVHTPEEDVVTVEETKNVIASNSEAISKTEPKRTKKEKFAKVKSLSERVAANKKLVSRTQTYPLDKAVNLLTQFKAGKFDETVELHLNVREQGTSGTLTLPHGTGKTLKIKVADDELLATVEKGNIDFDVLVATPDMMPKLAKVARILGPKGLMPNPKNGTVTTNPEDAVKKLSGGEIRFKTEPKAPVIHLIIGKLSFGDKKILENAQTVISTIGTNKIKSAILTSTMSPGIKLQVN